jgi:hypothetical protein
MNLNIGSVNIHRRRFDATSGNCSLLRSLLIFGVLDPTAPLP